MCRAGHWATQPLHWGHNHCRQCTQLVMWWWWQCCVWLLSGLFAGMRSSGCLCGNRSLVWLDVFVCFAVQWPDMCNLRWRWQGVASFSSEMSGHLAWAPSTVTGMAFHT